MFKKVYFSFVIMFLGCSTTELDSQKPLNPPSYTLVPHPQGMDLGDLSAIFSDEKAPKEADFYSKCDADFLKLHRLSQSKDELDRGVGELVRQDPVSYHWCFYGKIFGLESQLKTDLFIDQKQKEILNSYEFLVPVAKNFLIYFHDSRYLRWASTRYKKVSEWIFYRKLELTPAGTFELVQPENPFGLYRDLTSDQTVISKYNLVQGSVRILPQPTPSVSATPQASPRVSPTAQAK